MAAPLRQSKRLGNGDGTACIEDDETVQIEAVGFLGHGYGNAVAVQKTFMQYTDLKCKPTYHPDGLVPMTFVQVCFPSVPAVSMTFEQYFLYRRNIRKAQNSELK